MSKNIKNAVAIILIILSIIMVVLTLNYAKNNLISEINVDSSNDLNFEKEDFKDLDIDENFSDDGTIEFKGGKGNSEKGNVEKNFQGKENIQFDDSEVSDGVKEQFPIGDASDKEESTETRDLDFMADGNFAGAGENVENKETYLTISYILFIGFWLLVLSASVTYLIMSKFSCKYSFETTKKVVIYAISVILITIILVSIVIVYANKVYLNTESVQNTLEYSSTDDLHIDMSNWNYDETNNVYWQIGLVYVSNPETVEYESLGIYVPGDYFKGTQNSNGKYTCTINTEKTVGNYTAETAPIVLPVNTAGYSAQAAPTSYSYNGLSDYLNEGFIYVYAGCRGRNNGEDYSGGAPWGVTDLKSAIRYIRYNGNELPGNTESIFVFGMSGGGAQSVLLGTTGDSELYTPYLESIGAIMTDDNGNTISDSVLGTVAWCPITSLDYANEAYEWNMGQYTTTGSRSDDSWTRALSIDLAVEFAKYINELGLVDKEGNILTLDVGDNYNTNGIYTFGSYYDYILGVIEDSLSNYLEDNYTDIADMTDYINSLNENSDRNWVEFDENTRKVTIYSIGDFVVNCKNATKDVGAFDDLNRSQGENALFGNDENDSLHWDLTMAKLLKDNSEKYSQYLDYDIKYEEEYNTDVENVDKLGNDTTYRQNMYNPMYYISDYYEGYQTSNVSKYWRIRTGITQGDTSLTVETNLALALEQMESVETVDFETVWAKGHTKAERTGDSTENFINWINECLTTN